jgi:predicted transcriptional regulator
MMNRGRIEIMAQVLAFCTQPRLKTQIMYSANITFSQFQTYSSLLSSQRLLAQDANRYATTEKGYKFVQAFNELQNILEDAPLNAMSVGLLRRRLPANSV